MRAAYMTVCAMMLVVALCSATSQGALIVTNKTTGSVTWTTGTNWVGGIYPNGNTNGADLRIDATAATTFNLSAAITLNELWLGDTGGAGFFAQTMANGTGGTLTLDNEPGGGTVTITNAVNSSSITDVISATVSLNSNATVTTSGSPAGILNLSGVIANGANGAKGITKSGGASDGKLLLSGASSTFSGGVTLTDGILQVGNNSTPTSGAITSGPLGIGTLTINGGTLDTSSSTVRTLANAQQWNGSFTFGGTGAMTFNTGAVTLNGDPTITVNASTLTENGPIGETGEAHGFTKAGAGTLALGGANTYTGATTLSAGTLKFGNASALGSSSLTINGGTIDSTVASLAFSTVNPQTWAGSFTFTGTNDLNMGTGAVTLTADPTVTVTAKTLTIGGAIGESGGAHSLTKAGAGTLALNGPINYTGGTAVNMGILKLAGDNETGGGHNPGGITMNSGTTLSLVNANAIGGTGVTLAGSVTVSSTVSPYVSTATGPIALNGTVTLSNNWDLRTNPVTVAGDTSVSDSSNGAYLKLGALCDGTTGGHILTISSWPSNGTVTLGKPAGTFTGTFRNASAGVISIADPACMGTGTLQIDGTGGLTSTGVSGTPMVMSTTFSQVWNTATLNVSSYLNTGPGPVTLGTNVAVKPGNGQQFTVGGPMGDGGNAYGLTKDGGNYTYVFLAGNNTYTGQTWVKQDTLTLTSTGSLATSKILIGGGTVGNAYFTGSGTIHFTPGDVITVTNQPGGKPGQLNLTGGMTFDLSGLNGGVAAPDIVVADWSTGGSLASGGIKLNCTPGWGLKQVGSQLVTSDPTAKPVVLPAGGFPGAAVAATAYTFNVTGSDGAWPYKNWRVEKITWNSTEPDATDVELPLVGLSTTVTPSTPPTSAVVSFVPPYGGTYKVYVAVTSATDVDSDPTEIIAGGTMGCNVLSPLPDAVLGSPYPTVLTSANQNYPEVYALDSGALPDGLTLSTVLGDQTNPSHAVFSGTPTTLGTFTFTVKVTDDSPPPAGPLVGRTTYTVTVVKGAPYVTTAATDVTETTATSGGEVVADGGEPVTARGIVWSTSANPTLADNVIPDAGTGLGTFTGAITGLSGGTTYHVRAYATNSLGTGYGDDVTFSTMAILPTVTTTAVTSITDTSADTGGEVTSEGGAAVTARGVVYATTADPDILTGTVITDAGTGLGIFASSLTGLTASTTYHVRAFATNSVGTAYGDDVSFTTTGSVVELPMVTTAAISNVGPTSADGGGSVTSDGGSAATARGVCWSTNADPTTADSLTSDGSGTGSFVSALSGLTPATTYHVRAYATNSAGTAYGSDVSFTTFYQGDINRDGSVNLADLKLLVAAWNSDPASPNWNPNADIDSDGFVNLADLKILVANWNQHLP